MRKTTGMGLVLAGMVLGCGAAATLPTSFAELSAGDWGCYQTEYFTGSDAQEKDAATRATRLSAGLNNVARDAPAGTITTMGPNVCIKH